MTFTGGLGERYCSQKCYDAGGATVTKHLLQNWTGDCSVCRGPVSLRVGSRASMVCWKPGYFLFHCGSPSCIDTVRSHVLQTDVCAICGTPLEKREQTETEKRSDEDNRQELYTTETSQQDVIEQIKTFASDVHKNLSQEDRMKITLGGGIQFLKSEWENLLKDLPTPLDLKGADFSNCSFINANFNNANLENCNFSDCYIAYSHFDGANLNGSCFDNSGIACCLCANASFRNASFENVKFGVAQFINADLSDCSFNNSEWIIPPFFNEKTKTETASFLNCKIQYSKNDELGFKKYLSQEQLSQLIIEKSKTDKKGCYIATATYGDYNHPNVILFAHFRDNILSERLIGKLSIKIYYLASPYLAKLISRFPFLKKISKILLDGIANRLSNLY